MNATKDTFTTPTPGPGIFDTSFGRVGGAICFDAFTRETVEGFKKSAVELVVIVSCWGVVQPMDVRPAIMRIDVPPRYLSADYYFVQAPRRDKFLQFLGNLMQEWGFRGLPKEYEARRARHID